MSIIDKALQVLNEDDQETYICFLREIVKAPSVGGYGQYLGSLAPLVFATEMEKAEALRRMSEHDFDMTNAGAEIPRVGGISATSGRHSQRCGPCGRCTASDA